LILVLTHSLLRRSSLVPLIKVMEKRAGRAAAAQAHNAAGDDRVASARREVEASSPHSGWPRDRAAWQEPMAKRRRALGRAHGEAAAILIDNQEIAPRARAEDARLTEQLYGS
jgi:hypothetical protein